MGMGGSAELTDLDRHRTIDQVTTFGTADPNQINVRLKQIKPGKMVARQQF